MTQRDRLRIESTVCDRHALLALVTTIALLCAGCNGGSGDQNNAADGADTAVETDTGDTTTDSSNPQDGSTSDASEDTGMDAPSDGGDDASTGDTTVPERFDFCQSEAVGETHEATPDDYRAKLDAMSPGDVLKLAPGTYDRGLPIRDMNGSEDNCFVIEGPQAGEPAVFTGSSSRNTVSIVDSSYVVIRNIELDGLGEVGDAVKAEGTAEYAHHIVLEGLRVYNHAPGQQIVGISTKCPAWRWVIRGNHIDTAGTGLYLGNSDGNDPFVDGLIEYNVVLDTLGYNMQIKHQNSRPDVDGMPDAGETIIRHNVFSKARGANADSPRPNLLVGHFPPSGRGADDQYLIYGNFFWGNPTEALFQGEGNVALYANAMINRNGPAVRVQPHNDVPRRIHIFANTVLARARSIRVAGADSSFDQIVAGNAVFAGRPIDGGEQRSNVADTFGAAGDYLARPDGAPGVDLDLHPASDALDIQMDTTEFESFLDWDRDFDGRVRDYTTAGAYSDSADSQSWQLDRSFKGR